MADSCSLAWFVSASCFFLLPQIQLHTDLAITAAQAIESTAAPVASTNALLTVGAVRHILVLLPGAA